MNPTATAIPRPSTSTRAATDHRIHPRNPRSMIPQAVPDTRGGTAVARTMDLNRRCRMARRRQRQNTLIEGNRRRHPPKSVRCESRHRQELAGGRRKEIR